MSLHRVFLLAFICQITSIATLSLRRTNCDPDDYKKLGCFKANPKGLNELLITDRDASSPKNDGHKVKWGDWKNYIHSLVCRCAKATRKQGYTVFGIQNYGECWSGQDAEIEYDREGPSDDCFRTFQDPPCDINKIEAECAGKNNANYVYVFEAPKDECSLSPCKNGATCKNTAGGFHCVCTHGFKGQFCEQDINECQAKPCKNGATCVNTLGHYLCKCKPGYTGTHCEQDVDECTTSPCQNGATCTNTLGGFTCKCQQGFQGKLCDQDINECQSGPCKNEATCVNTLGGYHCKCKPGYTGTHCEQVINPCQSNPCQHGGSCERKGNGFRCKCVTGFTGKHCNKDVNECRTRPCRNGGTCVNTLGSFHCLCPAGLQGKLCQQGIDACSLLKPCKNGAQCVNQLEGFKCMCPAGITGMRCDIDVNECQQPVCSNGGSCVNTFGSFECVCKSGFSGKYCEDGPGGCSTPSDRFDLGLVIDGSGSVGNHGFAVTKMFILNLVNQFTVNADKTHFGIIVYSDNPHLISEFSNWMYYHPIQLKLRILSVEFPDGQTRTDKALKMAGKQLYGPGKDREHVPHVLVVITDGKTAPGSEPYNKVLKRLKDRNVTVIAVGIGNKVSRDELRNIAMGEDDRVLEVPSFDDLTNKYNQKLGDLIRKSC